MHAWSILCCHDNSATALNAATTTAATFDARIACAYQIILVGNLAEDAAHDLARACLGHAGRPVDGVWGGNGSNGLAHCRH